MKDYYGDSVQVGLTEDFSHEDDGVRSFVSMVAQSDGHTAIHHYTPKQALKLAKKLAEAAAVARMENKS